MKLIAAVIATVIGLSEITVLAAQHKEPPPQRPHPGRPVCDVAKDGHAHLSIVAYAE